MAQNIQYGTFTNNFLFAGTINLLRNVLIYANNIKKTGMDIAARYRVDFGTAPKQLIRYSTDILQTDVFAGGNSLGDDGEDMLQHESDLLLKNRFPVDPDHQALEGGKMRIIHLSVERFISGRAFDEPYVQNDFWGIMLGWTTATKEVADETNFRAWLFTKEADRTFPVKLYNYTLATNISERERVNRMNSQILSSFLASLFTNVMDYTRLLNGFGNMRNYNISEFDAYGKPETMNKLIHVDVPMLFHKDGVESKFNFELQHARMFGEINDVAGTGDSTITWSVDKGKPTVTKVGTVRSHIDQWLPSNEPVVAGRRYRGFTRLNTVGTPTVEHFYFAGEPIANTDTAPAGASYTTEDTFDTNTGNPTSVVDRIRFVHKEAPLFWSGWVRADAHYNSRSGVTQNYTVYEFDMGKFDEYPIFDVVADYTMPLPS